MSTRSAIVMATVTFGALAVGAAAMVGAYTVVDDRAAQIFKAEPRAMTVEKRSASAHSSRATVRRDGTQTARAASAPKLRTAAPTERQTVGSAAAASAAPPPPSRQGNARETRPAPTAMLEEQQQRRAEEHHGRKHARRLARPSEQPQGGDARASQDQNARQSTVFFPFR